VSLHVRTWTFKRLPGLKSAAWQLLIFVLVTSISSIADAAQKGLKAEANRKVKVLLITGGHGFEQKPFFKIFNENPEIAVTFASQGKTDAAAYDRDDLLTYDVVVLYDMPKTISETQKAKFLSLFDKGIGLLVLHHALVSYQQWPQYEKIVGGKYLTENEKVGDTVTPASSYHEGLEVPIVIVATNHPVTEGVRDFTIVDEIYAGVRVQPDVALLFVTTPPLNRGRPMGWYRRQGKSRVVYLQLGHGPEAYENANFQRLVANSIRWTAGN